MSGAGTLDLAAIELSKLLRPLATESATPGKTKAFFAQMGFALTDAQVAAISVPLNTAATRVTELLGLITQLVDAIDSGDPSAIVKGADAIAKIGEVLDAIPAVGSQLAGQLPGDPAKRIFDALLYRYMESGTREVNDILDFLGVLEREEHNEESLDPDNPPFTLVRYDFGRVGDWLSDPAKPLADLYDIGTGAFDGTKLFARAEKILAGQGLPVLFTSAPPRLDVVFLELAPKTTSPAGVVVTMKSPVAAVNQQMALGTEARAELALAFALPANATITITSDGNVIVAGPGSFGGAATLKVIAERTAPPEPFLLLGEAGGSRVEMGRFTLTIGTRVASGQGSFLLQGDAEAVKVKLDTSRGDGFLTKILPATNVEADFSVTAGFSTDRGVYFGGSSALEVRLPVHIDLGPVSIQALTLGVQLEDGTFPLSIGADIKAALGPLVAVVQNMGVTATFTLTGDNGGNLGPVDFGLDFKQPDGVGLSIDTGVVKGGGFLGFKPAQGEYFGALELSFQNVIALKAVGIINTKMPDGSQGFALLILITAEFAPIQLGFGFTLVGVGGLLALNRTLDTEALRTGVRTGAVNSILFPQDVVANIGKIISDLKSIFPLAQGHFVIGPMGKLGWGTPTLITLEIGVILDIPQPQFVILGVLRCILPSEDAPILQLQVNFAGGIDFDRGLIWFDASLFDSRLLIYTLAGDMALRIGWGEQTVFVISVGGFHPSFQEIPPDLRSMKRITISLLSGDNPRLASLTYFAVTSNTVQNGARTELYAAACGFNLYGFFGYDLLVQFNPFHFVADIYAGLAIRRKTKVLAGVSAHCQLSGPTPWRARGEATLEILFFDITVDFDVTWGDDGPAQIEQGVNVSTLVRDALKDDRNWMAAFPANTHPTVTVKKLEPPVGKVILHPFGVLSVSQKVVPLGIEINKFGNRKPEGATYFELTFPEGGTQEVREEFAMSQFLRMTDSEKLSRKSFEKMRSGLRFATGDSSQSGASVQKDVSYELSYVQRKLNLVIKGGLHKLFGTVFSMFARGGAVTKSVYSTAKHVGNTPPSKIDVGGGPYSVVNAADLTPHGAGMTAMTETEAHLMHDQLVAANPALAGKVLVVSAYELS